LTAGFRADAAMFHAFARMFGTFFGAGVAYIRTELAIGPGEISVQLHHLNRRAAGSRALQVQPDTGAQGMYIVLFQTGVRTLMAHLRTVGAGIDTVPIN